MRPNDYPVTYTVEPPARFTRLGLAIRILVFLALGTLGLSFGGLILFAYLALPAVAAIRLMSGRSSEEYRREDGPKILSALHWLAAASAWVGLIADRFPVRSPDETVALSVETTSNPTASSALWRVIKGLPSALVLALLGWLGLFVWLWAAISVLLFERVGPSTFAYLVGLQRWTLRLLVYQASLVDEYPPFSFRDSPPQLPRPIQVS